MSEYIAFLRAINVSGTNLIRMEDLKAMLAGIRGLKNIRTYIASGNIMFETADTDVPQLEEKIEKRILKEFGLEVPTIIRSKPALQQVVKNNPFAGTILDKETVLYTAFFKSPLTTAQAQTITSLTYEAETFIPLGSEVFILQKKPLIKKDVFSNANLEKKIKAVATSRNWNTVLAVLK